MYIFEVADLFYRESYEPSLLADAMKKIVQVQSFDFMGNREIN